MSNMSISKGIFVINAKLLQSISLIGGIISIHLIHKESSKPVPKFIRLFALNGLAKFFGLEKSVPQKINQIRPDDTNPKTAESNEKTDNRNSSLNVDNILVNVLEEIKGIKGKMEERDEESVIASEWKLLAKLLDRVLFYICLISFIIVTLAVFVA